MSRRYALGLDFGTESGRAVLVAVDDGEEAATAVQPYPHGVITEHLPGSGVALPPDWALQHPEDYMHVLDNTIPKLLQSTGVDPEAVAGIGVDFTSCTMMPATRDGRPLCLDPAWALNPHAWVKLWKHHAAQKEADIITEVAQRRGEAFLERYGGRISSEWFFPKALQILREAPEVYAAADRLIELGDWIVWRLCGRETRNACAAGYKALWDGEYPSRDYFAAVDPRFAGVVDDKMGHAVSPVGMRAGDLLPEAALAFGLMPGAAVSVGTVDGHVCVPATGVSGPGDMTLILGTSLVQMVNAPAYAAVPGLCGIVRDGIIPGYYGYEAGQAAGGDTFAWFIANCLPQWVYEEAGRRGGDVHEYLSREADRQAPGQSGLVALDWWNGNRCPLNDADVTGLFIGLTLSTTPVEMYRALLESTAFGMRQIIDQMESGGVPVHTLHACGGITRNPFYLQMLADVTGKPLRISASNQTAALGAAMWGAVAAGEEKGGHATIADAARCMARMREKRYLPRREHQAAYEKLYHIYLRLQEHFGRADAAMRELKLMRRGAAVNHTANGKANE